MRERNILLINLYYFRADFWRYAHELTVKSNYVKGKQTPFQMMKQYNNRVTAALGNTNKNSKNNFAKRGNTFNNKKYATRKNQGRASIHQIDNMHEESQD